MKKILCILMSMAMLICMVSCGDDYSNKEPGLYRDGELVQTWDDLLESVGYTDFYASGVITKGHFKECNGELVLPDTTKEIDDYAFKNCEGLTSVVIPESVKEIGTSPFDRTCDNLTTIVILNDDLEIPTEKEGNGKYDQRLVEKKGITIKARKGSKAEEFANEYAEQYGFKFESI